MEENGDSITVMRFDPNDFDKGTIRTVDIDKKRGIMAIVGVRRGVCGRGGCDDAAKAIGFIFLKKEGWTKDRATAWTESQ